MRHAHDVVVTTVSPPNEHPFIACGLHIDGHEFAVPAGASLSIDISDQADAVVTIRILASSIRFEASEEPTSPDGESSHPTGDAT